MKCIDYKCTIWQRLHFNESTDMLNIINLVENEHRLPNEFCDEGLGFVESEILYDTEEFMPIKKNDFQNTIKVYDDSKFFVWGNGN
jgi:hypothetical protein